jgi:hypothetical protein
MIRPARPTPAEVPLADLSFILPRAGSGNGVTSEEPREPEWLPRVLSFRARARWPRAAVHDVLEVVLARREVVLGRDLRRMAQPRRDDVGRVLLHPVGLAGGPKVLEEPRPWLVPGLGDDPLKGVGMWDRRDRRQHASPADPVQRAARRSIAGGVPDSEK